MTEHPVDTAVLNDDHPQAVFTTPDGTVIRNLSAAEYAASYAEGTAHTEFPGSQVEPDLAGEGD